MSQISGPNQAKGARWSSGAAFYLATIGASVGLGSIWRFPYLAGSGGGGAFIFVFFMACILIGSPLLIAEFLIGRHSQRSPPFAAGIVAMRSALSPRWNVIGVLGTISAFLIISYYTVIAGWVAAYTWKFANGTLTGLDHAHVVQVWRQFLANPWEVGVWHLLFVLLVATISACGVSRGLEIASKIRAPILLALMLGLTVYALITGDARRGLSFSLLPDFSAIRPPIVLAAIGQAFFAIGIGMAIMMSYGSYLNRGISLVRSSIIVSGAIMVVSILATLLVFPLVFRFHLNPAQGPELVFDVLATAFAEMPGGRIVGASFFMLLVFAALTPSLAGLEPLTSMLQQRKNLSRASAAFATAGCVWLVGIASVLSFNLWSSWYPLRALPGFEHRTFFEAIDYIASNIFLPVGALLTSVFVGWRVDREILIDELSETTIFARRGLHMAAPLYLSTRDRGCTHCKPGVMPMTIFESVRLATAEVLCVTS